VNLTAKQLNEALRSASDAGRQVAKLEAKVEDFETREEDEKEAAPAQTKLAPTYPQFTTGGSAGLPWYSKGASLSVPFQLGQATDVDDASAEVRYTIDAFDGGFAVEKSTVTLLAADRGGAPVNASSAMFAMRVAFGERDEARRQKATRVCTPAEAEKPKTRNSLRPDQGRRLPHRPRLVGLPRRAGRRDHRRRPGQRRLRGRGGRRAHPGRVERLRLAVGRVLRRQPAARPATTAALAASSRSARGSATSTGSGCWPAAAPGPGARGRTRTTTTATPST
jgi:hypothetical protein